MQRKAPLSDKIKSLYVSLEKILFQENGLLLNYKVVSIEYEKPLARKMLFILNRIINKVICLHYHLLYFSSSIIIFFAHRLTCSIVH